ncbi:MAG: protein phosphatase 2C domain-containing protein [Polyangiales bacterium]|nr:serine/threonine-protein phosphatase [Myxococcales bacterium]MCB9660493.1 serine/threonine-protein phosphatase [Sandaracinaceae bacterium]
MQASGVTHIGRRPNNEDSYRIEPELGLFLVADGMGGYEGGEVASRLVVDTLAAFFAKPDEFTDDIAPSASALDGPSEAEERMALAIRMAHREVQQEAQGRLREMGSTLAALHVHDSKVLIAHVGDSRVYRIRDGHIEQMTRDHSLTADLEAAGCESMLAHLPPHYRHMVTRVIAANANAQPDFRVVDAQAGDTFVLCSDGVHDVLGGDAILDAVDDAECEEASERVVARAFAEGTQDNITVVVVRV